MVDSVRAFLAERDAVLDVIGRCDASDFAAPSACDGWSVRDVVAHMGTVAGAEIARAAVSTRRVEDANEVAVRYWDGCSDDEVVARYRTNTRRWARLQRFLHSTPVGRIPLPLGDLGVQSAALLCDALVFDTYCHLRWDLSGPDGPLDTGPAPPAEGVEASVATWMFAGLPAMCGRNVAAALADADGGSLRLRVAGIDGGDRYLRVDRRGHVVAARHCADEAVASITTPAHSFPIWATHRRRWRDDDVSLGGDEELAASVCDAIRII